MKSKRIAALVVVSVLSPATWPSAPAAADESRPPAVSAPDATEGRKTRDVLVVPSVSGLPNRFLAGGEWQEFTLTLDNTGNKVLRDLSVMLWWDFDEEYPGLQPSQVRIEMKVDGVWREQTFAPPQPPHLVNSDPALGGHPIQPGRNDFPLRMKFTADTPPQFYYFGAGVNEEYGDDEGAGWIPSEIYRSADPDPKPTPDPEPTPDPKPTPDPEPTPDPGGKPAPDPGDADPTPDPATDPAGTASPAPAADGRLADTGGGTGPWPVAAGAAVTLGTALTMLARARRRREEN
ncbi:hypothetical protein ACFU8I_09425 [Streptomyces sp. NPDC057540]|uniref:hypothetical protein n=1 Tax=Streptomyces sp. NPDC057540 TaxID=3346160 RepID=UPI0036B95050